MRHLPFAGKWSNHPCLSFSKCFIRNWRLEWLFHLIAFAKNSYQNWSISSKHIQHSLDSTLWKVWTSRYFSFHSFCTSTLQEIYAFVTRQIAVSIETHLHVVSVSLLYPVDPNVLRFLSYITALLLAFNYDRYFWNWHVPAHTHTRPFGFPPPHTEMPPPRKPMLPHTNKQTMTDYGKQSHIYAYLC